jgi:predicted nucleic acid-binding protein
MSALCFVDTNLLVYSRDSTEPDKQPRAHEWLAALWSRRCGRTGLQVLNEYYVAVTQKLDPGLPEEEAWQDVEHLFAWQPVALTAEMMRRARASSQRYALSWWDALIVAAAQVCACRYLITEDLQDGQELGGTQVIDPFRHRPDEVLASRR